MNKQEKKLNKFMIKITKIFIKAERKNQDYFKVKNKINLMAMKKGINIQINETW